MIDVAVVAFIASLALLATTCAAYMVLCCIEQAVRLWASR